MPLDISNQPIKHQTAATSSRNRGKQQPQEIPDRENPEPAVEPGTYPGVAPSFFPYTQYPNLTWQPRVDIFEDHDNFLVIAEVPGVQPEQLNVENTSNLLLIRGQNQPLTGSGGTNTIPRYQERVCGSFFREIPLPPYTDIDQAEAKCRDGLLEIRIPKKQISPHQPLA
ncbi:MAG: Hsp20/alpha crystallin family protein [Thermacetogeniaceae bacterium]